MKIAASSGWNVPVRHKRPHTFLGLTTSVCPECLGFVQARIVCENQKIFLDKWCPVHGPSKALIEEDADYFIRCSEYAQPGSVPLAFATAVRQGCPHDCGLCPRHEQHCCHPIIEITNYCNLSCPICMADHSGTFHLSPTEFQARVEHLVTAEGTLENLTLSGGEPTLHPELSRLFEIAARPEIARVSLVTNGLRIAQDSVFCDELLARGIYVILQYDGVAGDADRLLRGTELADVRCKALSQLEQRGIPCQLLFVAARNVNELQLGHAIDLLFQKDFILSLAVQPLTFSSNLEGQDPMDRLTLSGVIRLLAGQSRGVLTKEDFFPLPCPNPRCVSLTYLLGTDSGAWVPLPRFVDIRRHLSMLSESATLPPSQELEDSLRDILSDLWSTSGECPQNERIMGALRRLLLQMSEPGLDRTARQKITERSAKSIFIHQYMDRYNFDLARLPKCCHHYPQRGGRHMPICSYNLFHRSHEKHVS